MNPISALLSLLLGYLFGSIPVGVVVGRLYGVDVRKVGSGKTGGTNVARAAGRTAAILTILGDVGKGVIPVLLARWIYPDDALAAALAGFGSVLGHNFSFWIGFKGGAGTMTGLGSLAALSFPLLLAVAPVPALMAYVTRMSSVGSLTASAQLAILGMVFVWLGGIPAPYLVYCLGVAILSWYAHRTNIERLQTGTERRYGQKA